ncbi:MULTISPECIES: phosphotransferase [unclassified Brevibacterium]|uniref:phosphotransferase family protein n=1 Tax=unclassified Brevibacterium TaxID=2614124 RepID=UPI001E35F208|nr:MULTISPECIES: phosphotransferase [unclassified Brevibacterium]MCD1285289.1 hypothetical protein [Brevibacterium sp. CCUG 69071]MDK8434334.1 phosphotransferase [Brevibacterium sp. H-BE7]
MSTANCARLPFVDELRSAQALSGRLGFPVQPQRIRVKPGRSAIVAWRREGRRRLGGFENWGWTAVVTSEDKLANLQRRAGRLGQSLTIHEAGDPRSAGATGGVLLSGGLLADARLGKEIARALGRVEEGEIEVLGYNPGRRVLLKHVPAGGANSEGIPGSEGGEGGVGDMGGAEAPRFVRIAARSQTHLVETTEQWTGWNLPTLPAAYLGGRQATVWSPWWGIGDLLAYPDHSLAEEVGVTIAELHRHTPVEAVHPIRTSPLDQVGKGAGVLADLVPAYSVVIDEIVTGLQERLSAEVEERVIHGDLSPDQVLVGHSECRIIDLDRAGVGAIGVDLGRWLASCRRNGLGALETAFLDGYRQAGGSAVDLGAWIAWAMLITALEPWRTCATDWEEQTVRIIAEAYAELFGSPRHLGQAQIDDTTTHLRRDAAAVRRIEASR